MLVWKGCEIFKNLQEEYGIRKVGKHIFKITRFFYVGYYVTTKQKMFALLTLTQIYPNKQKPLKLS